MVWTETVKGNTYIVYVDMHMHCGAIYNIEIVQFIYYLCNPENWELAWATANAECFVRRMLPTTNDTQCTLHTLHICCYIIDNNWIRWLPHSKCSIVMKFKPPLSITLCGLGCSFIETFITAQNLNEQVFRLCFWPLYIEAIRIKEYYTLIQHVHCLSTWIFEFLTLSSSCM